MRSDELHLKYAPVMRFSRGERFFPMSVDDFVSYSALYAKDVVDPVVPRGGVRLADLTRSQAADTFLRSVPTGPFTGIEVASQWGASTLKLLNDWATRPRVPWSLEVARMTYSWLSRKTTPAARRFWWTDLLMAGVDRETLRTRTDLPRFVLPGGMRDAAIEAYGESQGTHPNFTYYHRTVKQGNYLNLQYWFFYPYNDWGNGYGGFNDHEGDWEGFHVFFRLDGDRPVEPPAHVCFLGHESRMTKSWRDPDVEKIGTHPVIYVAAGSHASYPQARHYPLVALYNLVDYATGESFTLDHENWRSRLPLEDAGWLSYLGSWGTRYWLPLSWLQETVGLMARFLPGEVVLPGVSAPRGPRFAATGEERESWGDPLGFAGLG